MLNCNIYNSLDLLYVCCIRFQKNAKVSETGLRMKFKATYEIVVATVALLPAPHFTLGLF